MYRDIRSWNPDPDKYNRHTFQRQKWSHNRDCRCYWIFLQVDKYQLLQSNQIMTLGSFEKLVSTSASCMTELWKYLVKTSDFIKRLKEFLVRVCIMHQFSKLLNTTWKHRHQREGKDSKQSSYTHCIRPFQSWKPRWHAHTNEPNLLQNAVQHHLVG